MTIRPVGAGASVRLTGTATTSSAFNVQSTVMRLVAKGASAHVAIGTEPIATNASFFILGGEEEQIALTKGSQAVVGITTGTTTILEAPEGTQMPFIVGDFVTLDTANDSNYTSKINHVKITDVNNNMPYGASGFAKSRITVAADTSGIITAYNSNSGGSVMTSLNYLQLSQMVKQQTRTAVYTSNKFNVLDNKMKLIREEIESVEFLVENRNGKKSMYIEGVFLQGNIKNRNGRMYPMETLRKEVSRYNENHIQSGRALGELGHPEGPTVNLDRVSHKIVSLKESGSNFIGKAKLLSTPMGKIASSLVEEGVKLGFHLVVLVLSK